MLQCKRSLECIAGCVTVTVCLCKCIKKNFTLLRLQHSAKIAVSAPGMLAALASISSWSYMMPCNKTRWYISGIISERHATTIVQWQCIVLLISRKLAESTHITNMYDQRCISIFFECCSVAAVLLRVLSTQGR
jgi:hypothetical protein